MRQFFAAVCVLGLLVSLSAQANEEEAAAETPPAVQVEDSVDPAPEPAAKPAPVETPPPPPPPAPAPADQAPKTLRVAVYDFELAGVKPRAARVVTDSVVAEIRKLEGVVVIGMDEIRKLLDFEAQKALLGCDDDSCLSEIADALGADILVVGRLSRLNENLVAEDGEEFLAAVGPAIKKLFPNKPLRAGMVRGVDEEMALRLNPPPLPQWVFWTGAALTGAGLAATGTFLALNLSAAATLDRLKEDASTGAAPGDFPALEEQTRITNTYGYGTAMAGGVALGLGLATGASAIWTDWKGYQEIDLE
jgi:hypothetical protein